MRKKRLALPLLCLVLALSACGGGKDGEETSSPSPAVPAANTAAQADAPSTPEPSPKSAKEMDPEDVERLEGTWACTGVLLDGDLVMFSDMPELSGLYDQTLSINRDGTYTFFDAFSHRGVWAPMGSPPFDGFEYSYLFSKQYDITYNFDENDDLAVEETKSSESYIVSLSEDMPDTLVWLEKIGGESTLFLYQRNGGSSDAISIGSGSVTSGNSGAATFSAPASSASATMGERNALERAKDYLNVMAFSYSSLVEQLEYEGYLHSEAVYGADHCGADWNEQAALKAASYLELMSFSRSGLIEQLEYEGFTHAQAVYGAEQNGY